MPGRERVARACQQLSTLPACLKDQVKDERVWAWGTGRESRCHNDCRHLWGWRMSPHAHQGHTSHRVEEHSSTFCIHHVNFLKTLSTSLLTSVSFAKATPSLEGLHLLPWDSPGPSPGHQPLRPLSPEHAQPLPGSSGVCELPSPQPLAGEDRTPRRNSPTAFLMQGRVCVGSELNKHTACSSPNASTFIFL